MSVWADAAARYRDGRELRTSGLGGRFLVQFEGGTMRIQLPSGATRRIDSAEFASAWSLLETGAAIDAVRMVSASAAYIQAVRRDLLEAGLGVGDPGSDDDIDPGTTAAALVEEVRTRAASPATTTDDSTSSVVVPAERDDLQAERDELVRELARTKAAVAVLEERLAGETQRADRLEEARATDSKSGRSRSPTGARPDPLSGFAQFIEGELASAQGVPVEVRAGIKEALEVSGGHPDLAVVQCRKVAEAIATAQYLRVTGASAPPPYYRATDLLEDIRDRDGVDMVIWNLHRNVFRVSNPAAHVLRQSGSRGFAMTLVAMVLVVATHVAFAEE